ncbi:hypothetical protein [Acidocella aromatica]|uniref:Uncharacterized protein n=1 Tax=Acidocella aromatica TaxID=1303579 RepID=A0A840VC07_9PROT|nr:hypothetical protein [Acidocella aromatica]MBB5373438.1 hypothetical protein [Acidocella aromatica]
MRNLARLAVALMFLLGPAPGAAAPSCPTTPSAQAADMPMAMPLAALHAMPASAHTCCPGAGHLCNPCALGVLGVLPPAPAALAIMSPVSALYPRPAHSLLHGLPSRPVPPPPRRVS